jgi:hypothetical protein
MIRFFSTPWPTLCFAACLFAWSVARAADNEFPQAASQLISTLQRELPAAQGMDFIVLNGGPAITDADHRLLAEQLTRLGLSQQPEAQAVLARYRRLRGQPIPFRTDPVSISTSSGARHVCILRFDDQTPYPMPALLNYMRLDPALLAVNRTELSRLSPARVQQHIVTHEIWHCLEETRPEAYLRFATRLPAPFLDAEREGLLLAILRNHAEVGADLFATLMDLRAYGDHQMLALAIAVREANLATRRDMEHYTVSSLVLLRDVSPATLKATSIPGLADLVDSFRRSGLDPEAFAATYREVNAQGR